MKTDGMSKTAALAFAKGQGLIPISSVKGIVPDQPVYAIWDVIASIPYAKFRAFECRLVNADRDNKQPEVEIEYVLGAPFSNEVICGHPHKIPRHELYVRTPKSHNVPTTATEAALPTPNIQTTDTQSPSEGKKDSAAEIQTANAAAHSAAQLHGNTDKPADTAGENKAAAAADKPAETAVAAAAADKPADTAVAADKPADTAVAADKPADTAVAAAAVDKPADTAVAAAAVDKPADTAVAAAAVDKPADTVGEKKAAAATDKPADTAVVGTVAAAAVAVCLADHKMEFYRDGRMPACYKSKSVFCDVCVKHGISDFWHCDECGNWDCCEKCGERRMTDLFVQDPNLAALKAEENACRKAFEEAKSKLEDVERRKTAALIESAAKELEQLHRKLPKAVMRIFLELNRGLDPDILYGPLPTNYSKLCEK